MYRWSQLFIPTLREAPADAEVASHKFLVRAGYIRQLSAGIYSYLFLGQRAILKISNIVREEMDKIGQEFYLPAIHPREIWEASGRWEIMGDNMFRLKDRKGADLCLGMTEEEVMTEIARKELRSYKELPQIWYQIQQKFRDEPRPKGGLMRVRQFTMKDSYSFDLDKAGLDVSYQKHRDTYCRIFERCGLSFVVVDAHSGAMGGSKSEEFMVYTDAGEDFVVSCPSCKYAANLEKAQSKIDAVEDLVPAGDGKPELVHTPGKGAIADVAEFLKVSPKQDIKVVAYMAEKPNEKGQLVKQPVVALLRGDHTVNESKLAAVAKVSDLRPMNPEELELYFQGPGGFVGPVGLKPRSADQLGAWPDAKKPEDPRAVNLVMDQALAGRQNMICGANKLDYHLRNVTPGKDFQYTVAADIRSTEAGEACINCGAPLVVGKTVEIGHIFQLGYKYTETMDASVLDKDGKEVKPIMGSYGIGIERILTAAIEQNHDDNGFWLPASIAPFEVVVVPVNVKDQTIMSTALKIAEELKQARFDVMLDDRDERPGVKFKDADLVGIPFRVTVGKKVTEGQVEVLRRSTAEKQDVNIAAISEYLQSLLRS
ncbi:MAG TPA: proline--tRNA ligase [Terriglobales bacterium]|nr:proline--tRNA ligase [Terriglobales bacterium]